MVQVTYFNEDIAVLSLQHNSCAFSISTIDNKKATTSPFSEQFDG